MTPAEAASPVPPSANGFIPSVGEIDVARVERRIERSLLKKVQGLIEDYPNEAVEVVRGWMAEDYYRH